MEFEVWVSVDATNYGQSQWSESLYFETTSADSNATEIATLISEIVRVKLESSVLTFDFNPSKA